MTTIQAFLGLDADAKINLHVCQLREGEYQVEDMITGTTSTVNVEKDKEIVSAIQDQLKSQNDEARRASKPKVEKAPTLKKGPKTKAN